MPYTTTWNNEGVYWKLTGVVTEEEVEQANGEMYGDGRFDSLKYSIWDTSNVERFDMSLEDIDISAETDFSTTRYVNNFKVALISNNAHTQDFCQRYIDISQALKSPWEFEIFNQLKVARGWVKSQ